MVASPGDPLPRAGRRLPIGPAPSAEVAQGRDAAGSDASDSPATHGRGVRLPGLLEEARELSRLPRVSIEMSGDDACKYHYRDFTRRHDRWRVIQNKAWGVALVPLPERPEDYLAGIRKKLRRRVERAIDAGYRFGPVDAIARIDEVLAINSSAAMRQGIPMHPDYFDEDAVRAYFAWAGPTYGVTDGAGVLRAYVCLRTAGDVAIVERILGHADALEDGVMYVLTIGLIQDLIARRGSDGRPHWLMYDMFSGASEGMRTFKHVIGCRPYRVSWSWRG